jgi:Holliday junction resolvasome RuvABC endonuclease subunit
MRIVGLDLSLTATGVADQAGARVLRTGHLRGPERLKKLGAEIDRICTGKDYLEIKADVVVMEGPSFGSEHSHQYSIGKLAGVVEVCLYQRGIPFVVVPPSTLKKFATNKGNASKDMVLAEAVRMNNEINDNNAADAFWLRLMGLAHYEQRDVIAPAFRAAVLKSIEWPVLKQAVPV